MKITSTKRLSKFIIIIIATILIGTGITVYQSSKIQNSTLSIGTTATTAVLPQTTTITTPTSSAAFCLHWDFFKDPKNYDDGESHEEIKMIQTKLGVTPVDGRYGPLTKEALDKFNKDYNIIIPAMGCCGNLITPAHLAEGLTTPSIIKFNDLYCSLPKPKVTITFVNYPPPDPKLEEASFAYISTTFMDETEIDPSQNNPTIKTIEIPYSGWVRIRAPYSYYSYDSLSSWLLYDNNTLLFSSRDFAGTYDVIGSAYNIAYDIIGDNFTWYGIEKNRDIRFEFIK